MTGLRALAPTGTLRSLVLGSSLVLALAPACQDGSDFVSGRDPVVCSDSIPSSCGAIARCVLDSDHYLEGRFPGAQKFIVRTTGEASLQFWVLLEDRLSAGSGLRLEVSEPTCKDKSVYDSKGADIFQLSSTDGMLGIPIHVMEAGDHLVVLSADAYCSYKVRYE